MYCTRSVQESTFTATRSWSPYCGRWGRRQEAETRTFGAVTEDVRAQVAWLDEQDVPIVAMESTGVYWKPV